LFHLSRNFFLASKPLQTIRAASLASRLAIALGQKALLCKARGIEGVALCDLGRFGESAAAYAEFWTHACSLKDIEREILAIKNVGGLYFAMAHWDTAKNYFQRAAELAAKHGYSHLELGSRNNMAKCSLQLNDAAAGLQTLLPFMTSAPTMKREVAALAHVHMTLAHLYLVTGEMKLARVHAHDAGRLAKLAGIRRTCQLHKALLGLINVKSGNVQRGVSALERSLAFAKRVDHLTVPDYLGMCVDACEAAGQVDKALSYLQELVAWKKVQMHAQIPEIEGLTESPGTEAGTSVGDQALRVRAQLLNADVEQTVRRLVETAVTAEMAAGHDLRRTFRVAKLARCLAFSIGWNENRIGPLSLGAQLCNIGMMAIPTRVLQKPSGLSDRERHLVQAHVLHGAELLRKSNLRVLNVASVVAAQHHERYDGTGYPGGLSGEAIALESRVVCALRRFRCHDAPAAVARRAINPGGPERSQAVRRRTVRSVTCARFCRPDSA